MTSGHNSSDIRSTIEAIYRQDGRRIFASLVRLFSNFDLAEEVLQEAFAAALASWSRDGIPANPVSWLISTGRFKAIDTIRRRSRFEKFVPALMQSLTQEQEHTSLETWDENTFKDDQLRLIFTCCHPALASNVQVALTLREICGLTTEEIAAAFFTPVSTMAQRLVRGKAKIREAKIPYAVPNLNELPERLASVLSVIYLVFNEGYSASSGNALTRPLLSDEAIRLGRHLLALLPEPDVMGLLALMLLHESRRQARSSSNGGIILLEDQDRRLWDQKLIAEGSQLVTQALAASQQRTSVYALQAAISAIHAAAPSVAATDWQQIVACYELLLDAMPSPVVELNRAVAIAMRDGPAAGLQLIDAILARDELTNYHLAHAARADLCRRLNQGDEARASYQRALALVKQEPERQFLEKRLRELETP